VQDREKMIRDRAHKLWIEDGQPHGKHNEHWERARRQIEQESLDPGTGSQGEQATAPKRRGRAAAAKAREEPDIFAGAKQKTGASPRKPKK